jgi:hypothetical protein
MSEPQDVLAGPYMRGALAALSAGAAAIHFSVMFAHFATYWAYGTFFLVSAWSQVAWAIGVCWRPWRWLLWAGAVGNAGVVAIYVVTRTVGDVIGPGADQAEAVGGVDVVCTVFEAAIVAGALLLLSRSAIQERRVVARSARRLLAVSTGGVLAATVAVSTPALAGPEGPDGMAAGAMAGMSGSGASAAAPTADQIAQAEQLITQTTSSLARYRDIRAALAAGYGTPDISGDLEYVFASTGGFADLDPQHPSALVYAVHVAGKAPILLGAMYIAPPSMGMLQIGGPLTHWDERDLTCLHGRVSLAGFGVPFYGQKCSPRTWTSTRWTVQILHVWIEPFTGGPFSADVSNAAIHAAAQEALITN